MQNFRTMIRLPPHIIVQTLWARTRRMIVYNIVCDRNSTNMAYRTAQITQMHMSHTSQEAPNKLPEINLR